MPFRWQINASAVAKLIGSFWLKNEHPQMAKKHAKEELAKTWRLNIKRMPKFGVRPKTTIARELSKRQKTHTPEDAAKLAIKKSPAFTSLVRDAIEGKTDQRTAATLIEKKATKNAKIAREEATQATIAASKATEMAIETKKRACQTNIMRCYRTKRAGVKKTRANAWFFTDDRNIYKMSLTGRSAVKRSAKEAAVENWVFPSDIVHLQSKAKYAQKEAEHTRAMASVANAIAVENEDIARSMKSVAITTIQTTRGTESEDRDLQKVQKSAPSVRRGNQKAHFYSILGNPYGGFVIGYIDGFDTDTQTVIELKHRSRGLFGSLREYERVQCFVYMKMLRVKKAKLIETFQGHQKEYDIVWDEPTWRRIEMCIVQVVRDLNQAEFDSDFRNELLDIVIDH